jgi:hypothetical protein
MFKLEDVAFAQTTNFILIFDIVVDFPVVGFGWRTLHVARCLARLVFIWQLQSKAHATCIQQIGNRVGIRDVKKKIPIERIHGIGRGNILYANR